MSLPLALASANDAIDGTPYLQAPSAAVAFWQAHVAAISGTRPRVGFVWRGHPKHLNDKNRSLSITEVLQLIGGAPSEIDWYCLQQPMTDDDRRALSSRPNIRLLDTLLNDFSDTAAAVTALDQVITVDTSIAHLTGALGRPVWLLLPSAPDWRWQRDRPDTPWYSSARLFRQPSAGDWSSVFREVQQALTERFSIAGNTGVQSVGPRLLGDDRSADAYLGIRPDEIVGQ